MGSQRVIYNWARDTHTLNIGWEVFFLCSFPSPPKENPSPSPVMFLGAAGCFSPTISPAPGKQVAVLRAPKSSLWVTLWWGSGLFLELSGYPCKYKWQTSGSMMDRGCVSTASCCFITLSGFSTLLWLPESGELILCTPAKCLCFTLSRTPPPFASLQPLLSTWTGRTTLPLPPATRTCVFTSADSAATTPSKCSSDTVRLSPDCGDSGSQKVCGKLGNRLVSA